jgi:hypothetical protein
MNMRDLDYPTLHLDTNSVNLTRIDLGHEDPITSIIWHINLTTIDLGHEDPIASIIWHIN